MGVSIKKTKKGISLTLKGTLGVEDAGKIASSIRENLGRAVTIDMKEVDTIDMSIIQIILSLGKTKSSGGVEFYIKGISQPVRETFCLAGLEGHLKSL